MVLLERLRGKWAVAVGLVIGFAMLAFVLTDFLVSGRSLFASGEMEVGSVNGEGIDYMKFMARYEERAQVQQTMSGQSLGEEASEYLRDQIWQEYVREGTLDAACEKLGLAVSAEELSSVVLSKDHPHPIMQQLFTNPETGAFEQEVVLNFLQNLDKVQPAQRAYWLQIENEISAQLLTEKYRTAVSKGLYTTKLEGEERAMMQANTADVAYVTKTYASVPDSTVRITEADAKRYYETHRNSYRQQERRDLSYALFEVKPGPIDFERAEEWMKKYRDEFATVEDAGKYASDMGDEHYAGKWYSRGELPAEIAGWAFDEAAVGETTDIIAQADSYEAARLLGKRTLPDSASARHILFSFQKYPAARAHELADSVLNVLKAGGDFAELAEKLSDDPGSASKGGDLGWFAQGVMVKPFGDACFMGAKGDRVVVESSFGVHVIEVLGHKGESERVDVAILKRNVQPGSETYQGTFNEASRFAALAHQPRPSWIARLFGAGKNRVQEVLAGMDTLLMAQGKTRREAKDVEYNSRTLNGMQRSREVIRWAFTAHEGDVSSVFEMDGNYIVAMVSRIKKSKDGYATFEAVREDAAAGARQEKKAEQLKATLAGAGSDVTAAAQAVGEGVQRASAVSFNSYSFGNAGYEPAAVGAAVALGQGDTSSPVAGNGGVFMVQTEQVAVKDEDVEQVRAGVQQTLRMRSGYEAYEALKRMSQVVDKRGKFF